MALATPHYWLTSETQRLDGVGHWRFVLKSLEDGAEIEASDIEPGVWGGRLDLLTVIRALESLDQPSWITITGCTRYVQQGILYGLTEWKENDWCWECFGKMTPVRDLDLWQRLDQILKFHRVDCGRRNSDSPNKPSNGPRWGDGESGKEWIKGLVGEAWTNCRESAMIACCVSWARTIVLLWINKLELKKRLGVIKEIRDWGLAVKVPSH
jgi:ribonuclease HI